MNNTEKFKQECLTRHYQGMSKKRALKVLGNLKTQAAKKKFIQNINTAKGKRFIR